MRQEVREYVEEQREYWEERESISDLINEDLVKAEGRLVIQPVSYAAEANVDGGANGIGTMITRRALVVFEVVEPPVVPSPLITG